MQMKKNKKFSRKSIVLGVVAILLICITSTIGIICRPSGIDIIDSASYSDNQALMNMVIELKGDDEIKKVKTIRRLSKLNDSRKFEILSIIIHDRTSKAKLFFIHLFYSCKDGDFNIFKEFFKGNYLDNKALLRGTAVSSLSNLQNEDTFELLTFAMNDGDPFVRRMAIRELATRDDSETIALIINALCDSDENNRMLAAETLGELGNKDAIKPLQKAMNDESPYVRDCVKEALNKLNCQ